MVSVRHPILLAAVALSAMAGPTASAAISYVTPGSTYSENFDSYTGTAATAIPFSDDSTATPTIPGWYAYVSGTSTVAGAVPATIYRNPTPVTPNAVYIYELSGTSTDGALGSANYDANTTPSTGYIAYGFALTNNTDQALTQFTLNYTPLSIAQTNTTTDSIGVSYAIGATGVADANGSYTTAAGMGFSVAGTSLTLTGPTVNTLTGINWIPGTTLFVRFKDINVGGTDRFTAIDDVSFSAAVPEPASLAIVGIAAAVLRHRS